MRYAACGLFVVFVLLVAPYSSPVEKQLADPVAVTATTTTTTRPGVSDAEWRTLHARRLTEARAERQEHEHSTDQVAPVADATSGTAAPENVPAVSAAENQVDECGRVPNPGPVILTGDTMRWCPMVAAHLDKYTWNNGDLFRLLVYMECESNGDPTATNPSSGTAGLYQHRPQYWAARSTKALGYVGDPYDPHDNVHVALWLVKTVQPMSSAWDGCASHSVVQQTLSNGGA